jgi:hypothetical protein
MIGVMRPTSDLSMQSAPAEPLGVFAVLLDADSVRIQRGLKAAERTA